MRRQTLPVTVLPAWTKLSGIEFYGVLIEHLTDHGIDKGSAIVATQNSSGKGDEQLMIVPKDMILSLEAVEQYAKSDKHLREVLDAVGHYARVRSLYSGYSDPLEIALLKYVRQLEERYWYSS